MVLVAVHSGAGNFVNEENYRALCKRACRVATELLDSGGGSALGERKSTLQKTSSFVILNS